MLTGVSGIELVPPVNGKMNVVDRIAAMFKNAIFFRAAIAFWTLPKDFLDDITNHHAERVFRHHNSFLCVDIQRPTNIDHLADLVRSGCQVFLNMRRLPKELHKLKLSNSPGLLHTKIILSDMENSQAEFWIGSHNWTKFALIGPNTEASMVLQLVKNAPLYMAATYLLEEIRDKYCRPFDLRKIEDYKKLQILIERGQQSKVVIELEGDNIDRLGGEVICIFGTENQDFESVSKVGSKLFVSAEDSATIKKYLYKAEIVQTGLLSATNPDVSGISFSARRYAFTEKRLFPYLKRSQVPGRDVLEKAKFFVNIQIDYCLTHHHKLQEPSLTKKRPLWVEPEWDPVSEKFDWQLMERLIKNIKDVSSFVSVPFDDERAKKKPDLYLQNYKERTLEEKRSAQDYQLISKKIIDY